MGGCLIASKQKEKERQQQRTYGDDDITKRATYGKGWRVGGREQQEYAGEWGRLVSAGGLKGGDFLCGLFRAPYRANASRAKVSAGLQAASAWGCIGRLK